MMNIRILAGQSIADNMHCPHYVKTTTDR